MEIDYLFRRRPQSTTGLPGLTAGLEVSFDTCYSWFHDYQSNLVQLDQIAYMRDYI